jgi:hypothetical protein
MPQLEMETANVFWHGDLEALVREVYNQNISVLDLVFEPHNGSYYEYTVNGESELQDIGDDIIVQRWIDDGGTVFDVSDVSEFDWTNEYELGVRHILHRLYKDGIIPAGKYLMKVWW